MNYNDIYTLINDKKYEELAETWIPRLGSDYLKLLFKRNFDFWLAFCKEFNEISFNSSYIIASPRSVPDDILYYSKTDVLHKITLPDYNLLVKFDKFVEPYFPLNFELYESKNYTESYPTFRHFVGFDINGYLFYKEMV